MQQAEITPSLAGIGRPSCPRCGTRMMLARIAPMRDAPDHDQRTFDCPKCGNEMNEIIQFK